MRTRAELEAEGQVAICVPATGQGGRCDEHGHVSGGLRSVGVDPQMTAARLVLRPGVRAVVRAYVDEEPTAARKGQDLLEHGTLRGAWAHGALVATVAALTGVQLLVDDQTFVHTVCGLLVDAERARRQDVPA